MTLQFKETKTDTLFIRLMPNTKKEISQLAKDNHSNLSEVARKLIVEGLKIAKQNGGK